MKLTLVLVLVSVTATFALNWGKKRDFIQVLQDESSVSSIDFTGDWKEIVNGQLGVNEVFRINYNGSRLADPVFVQYKFNDGSGYETKLLGGPDEKNIYHTEILIPIDAEKVVMWFVHINDPNKYDSDYGKNYHFQITKPSIVFEKNWDERVHGKLVAGKTFDLFYDSQRLKEGVEVQAQMKFVDDEVLTETLEAINDSSYEIGVISIHKDAEKVEMWFYYEDDDGNKHYDSDYGKNYHFPLSE
ncbi:uncharacterized protein LOC114530941 [Dendronephthya gigantea]|uniref:uncharacterized protein LOC114530941 n=1 Tax=Dendronephthya gigantea TaxID=151771 RepID=UPI00106CB152|nr:uncharacterized protein LOC114530941 [Dendronephthya gigantea]